MKMSESIQCCERCFRMVAKESTCAARLWLDLCEYPSGFPLSDSNDSIRILEENGLILTTDLLNGVKIRLKVYLDDEGNQLFCGGCCGSDPG
jgi:hypothetical protein